jgi:hypothetical protein
MRYDGVYKRYKLYSVTEEDIVDTGGAEGVDMKTIAFTYSCRT